MPKIYTISLEKLLYVSGYLHNISFSVKLKIFISVSGQFLVTVYMIQAKMKLTAVILAEMKFPFG